MQEGHFFAGETKKGYEKATLRENYFLLFLYGSEINMKLSYFLFMRMDEIDYVACMNILYVKI